MGKDKRSYKRIEIRKPAVVYSEDGYEAECNIKDISECGLAFEMPLNETNKKEFIVGDSIIIQFVDSFMFGREIEKALIHKKCLVCHITESEQSLTIGCYLEDHEFAHYVMHREVSEIYFRQPATSPTKP